MLEDSLVRVPDAISEPAGRFYRQYFADLHYVTSERLIIASLESIVGSVEKAIFPDDEPRANMPTLWKQVDAARAADRHNRMVGAPIAVTRSVDNYLVYVSELIALLFRTRPESLRGNEQVSLDQVLRHRTLEEFIEWQVDQRVNELSYHGFGDIAAYMVKRFGLELVPPGNLRGRIVRAIATRNLHVHKRGIIDLRFIETLAAEKFDTDGIVAGESVMNLDRGFDQEMEAVTEAVQYIDNLAVTKFNLPTSAPDFAGWWPKHDDA